MSSEDSNKGKKKAKRKFNLSRFLLFWTLVLLLIVIIGASVALGTAYAWVKNAPPLNYDELINLNQTTYIVDENDKVIDKLNANENRTLVTLDQVPKDLQNAVIAIEDKRFWDHNGFDLRRIGGAVWEDIKSGSPTQGASTITQQLVKNVYLSQEKRLKRKVIEIYYAVQLERRYNKKQILEAYLNTMGFSKNIAGVKEAALYYFGKDLNQLTLAEDAMLAGITNNPSIYSPYASMENANKRKKIILSEMLNQGKITQSQYDEAINQTIVLNKVKNEVETTYFSDMVINDVLEAMTTKMGYSEKEAEHKLYNGGLRIIATIDTDMQNMVEDTFQNKKLFPSSKEDENGILQPEAAAVVIDNATGEIKAVMGGRSNKVKRGLNRATQSLRQPGSSIKPLAVYAPALESGYTPATVIDDAPVTFGSYSPRNYDRRFRGLTTIRDAIRNSINTVAVQIVQDIGTTRSVEFLEKFGLTTIVEPKPGDHGRNDANLSSLALGGMTKGAKPIEMAAAYTTFPNQGIFTKPISFTKILDKDGNVLFENRPDKTRVLSAQTAYLMVDIMRGVVTNGTGTNANLGKMPAAGKTGTTSDAKDAWFTGYTPYYTATVWIGHDDPKEMNFTGGKYPATIWKAIMTNIHKKLPVKSFEMPQGLVSVEICTASGKRPSDLCALDPRGSTIRTELFVKGTEPAADNICDVHVTRDIDTETNQLASPYCPPALVQSKVFIQRSTPTYTGELGPDGKPITAGKAAPADAIYEAPTITCTKHTAESSVLDTIPIDPGSSPVTDPNSILTPTPEPETTTP